MNTYGFIIQMSAIRRRDLLQRIEQFYTSEKVRG